MFELRQDRDAHLRLLPGPGYDLRDYQASAVRRVRASLAAGNRRVVMVLPTGGGKTGINAEITRLALERGKRVLFLVHRRNLVEQTRAAFAYHGVVDTGIIMSGHETALHLPVQLATIQTYGRRIKLDEGETVFNFPADLILVDECHRAISKGYADVFSHYPNAMIIGCTATPVRGDGRGLGEVFSDIIDVADPKTLTERGYLVPVRYFCPDGPDLRGIKVVRGDYDARSLGERVNQPKLVGDVVSNWLLHAEGRKTIVFCVSVAHSRAVCAEFVRHGVAAYHLSAQSDDDERDYAFREMERGNILVICNVALYQEGTDVPDIACVSMARPTKSLGLYRQCVGRGLRPGGHDDCILLDHGGVVDEHGYVTDPVEWSLDGKKKAWRKKQPKDRPPPQPMRCTACNLVFSGASKCPDCGSEVKRFGKPVEVIEAELREVGGKRDATMVEKRRFYAMLRYYCDRKGYKPGYAFWKYKERFGVEPRGMQHVTPLPPDESFHRFIRHLYIKNRKRKEVA